MHTGALASESVDSLLPGGLIVNLIQGCAASRRVDCDDRLLLVPPPSSSRMPTEHSGLCRTLLDDGETRCSVPVKPGRQSCPRHTAAYDTSYKRYKDAENAAKDLRAAAQTKRGDVHTIAPEEIEPRIKSVRAYIEGLESELRLRNEHDQRFIGTPDKGHLKRLDALEKQLTHHRDIVEALRARLQRLKPAGQPTPPKHRRYRHRHTVSDPTPQPPTGAPSASRPLRRRSQGQPNQRRGGHAKSHSVQSSSVQGRKEHPVVFTGQGEEVDEEDHGRPMRPLASSFQVFEDSRMEGAWGLGPQAEYWRCGVAERGGVEGRQEESTAVAADGCEDDMRVLAHGQTARCFVEGAANTNLPSPSVIEPDGFQREPTRQDATSQKHLENEDNTISHPAPPSPLPRIVGEYPWVDPEQEEIESEPGPEGSHQEGYLKYAFAAILPAAMFVLTSVFARIRNRAPRPA